MIDSQKSFYATGRRKEAVARVWLQLGPARSPSTSAAWKTTRPRDLAHGLSPAAGMTETSGIFDIFCTVRGGGLSGQARCHPSRSLGALLKYNAELRGRSRRRGISPATPAPKSGRSTASAARARASSSPSASTACCQRYLFTSAKDLCRCAEN